LTTHYLEETQYLCDKIAIMDSGKIIAWDSPAELIRNHSLEIAVILKAGTISRSTMWRPVSSRVICGRIEKLKIDRTTHGLKQ